MYLLYVQGIDFNIKAWRIEWYDNRNLTADGINAMLKKGYVPMGIAYSGDKRTDTLYVKF